MAAVCEDETGDLVRKCMLVRTDENPADRCTDEDERPFLSRRPQEEVKIADGLLNGFFRRSGVTPCESGSVVRADSRCTGNLRLHESPIDREGSPARRKNDGRTALSGTEQVELATADVDKATGRRVLR
jgi:hypothetical protein